MGTAEAAAIIDKMVTESEKDLRTMEDLSETQSGDNRNKSCRDRFMKCRKQTDVTDTERRSVVVATTQQSYEIRTRQKHIATTEQPHRAAPRRLRRDNNGSQ